MVTFHVSFTSFFKECNIFLFVAATSRSISVGRSENLEGAISNTRYFEGTGFATESSDILREEGSANAPCSLVPSGLELLRYFSYSFFLDTTKHVFFFD